MKLNLPEPVQSILYELNRAGYEAYAVGGCVRDALLGRTPQDWDITTSAKPNRSRQYLPVRLIREYSTERLRL